MNAACVICPTWLCEGAADFRAHAALPARDRDGLGSLCGRGRGGSAGGAGEGLILEVVAGLAVLSQVQAVVLILLADAQGADQVRDLQSAPATPRLPSPT